MDIKGWKDVWLDNYWGRSDAAKNIDELMKSNYKGHKYVPWAVMQKWLYLMDEDSILEVIYSGDSLIHEQVTDIYTDIEGKVTAIKRNTFFVVLKLTFMGKVFTEYYPIQDNAYNAPNFVDSNMVNKSIQRAKAKLISTATGLGYSLYEFGDLQFEDDKPEKTTQNVMKKSQVIAPVKTEDVKPNDAVELPNTNGVDKNTMELTTYIMDNVDTIMPILQRVNGTMITKYGKAIDPSKGYDAIIDALSNVANIELFAQSIMKQHKESLK